MADDSQSQSKCILCGQSATLSRVFETDDREVRCDRCGHFFITDDFLRLFEFDTAQLHLLSGCTREQSEVDARHPTTITTKNYRELIERSPRQIAEKGMKLLAAIRRKSDHFGRKVPVVSERDYPLAYARNPQEFTAILHSLESQGSLEWAGSMHGRKCALTQQAFDANDLDITPDSATSDASTKSMDKKHVFLCYCRDNTKDVSKLRDDLIAAAEQVWWDQDILGGQDWQQEVRKALKEAYAVVACFSKETDSRLRSGMFPELADAIEIYREYAPGSVFLIPVRLAECLGPDIKISATQTLNSLQYIDLFPPSKRDGSLHRLIESLRSAPEHP